MWFLVFPIFFPIWTYLGIQFCMRFSVLADFVCGFAVLDEFFFGFAVSSIPQCPPQCRAGNASLKAVPIPPGHGGALSPITLLWGIGNFIAAKGLGICVTRGDPGHLTHVFSKVPLMSSSRSPTLGGRRSLQLPHIPVTAFSQTDRFLV